MAIQEKPIEKRGDEEAILLALRKAVLEHIGDTAEGKTVLERIERDGLSSELKKIGEKLAKRGTEKSSVSPQNKTKNAGLSGKEIEHLRRLVFSLEKDKGKHVKQAVKKKVKVVKKEKHALPQKSFTKKPFISEMSVEKAEVISKIAVGKPSPLLLPKPSFFERLTSYPHSSRRIWVALLAAVVVLAAGFFVFVYRAEWENQTLENIVRTIKLPAVSVNGDKLLLADYVNNVRALNHFYSTQQSEGSEAITPPENIRGMIIDRYVKMFLIRQSLKKFEQSVTEENIDSQLEELARVSGGKEELEKITNELYGWSLSEFVSNALVPILEEEKLAIFISQNEELNKSKEARIREIDKMLKEGGNFAELAKKYSEDTTAENGGDLDWFEKGDMVPEFENAAFSLKAGETSDPFKTVFGWHIVTVLEKDASGDKVRASHILIKNLSLPEYISDIRNSSKIRYFVKVNKSSAEDSL